MKRKILILIFLSFVFVFAGNIVENYYPEEVNAAFEWSTPKPTASPKPVWSTPRPTVSPTPAPTPTPSPTPSPTAKPTPTPTSKPSPTPEVTVTPDPNASPTPTPSPTPERPQLPAIGVPGLVYPATEAPKATLNPDEYQNDATPAPATPTPSPEPTKAPETNKPTWSGLIKFVSVVFYVAAVATAIYALVFFIICTLFGKTPSSGFNILKKKKKSGKKKKDAVAKAKVSPKSSDFENEADAYLTTDATPVAFQRREDADYHPVIVAEENESTDELTSESTAEETASNEEIAEEYAESTNDFLSFTENDLPTEEPVLETAEEEEEEEKEEYDSDILLQSLPEVPEQNKPLTFRRAVDLPDNNNDDK